MTPQDQINEIYSIVKDMERSRQREFWWGIARKVLVYGFIIFAITHPGFFIDRAMSVIQPIITKAVSDMYQDKQSDLQKMLQEGMKQFQ